MPDYNGRAYWPDGRSCRVLLDDDDAIVDSSALHCVWSGAPRFDAWFRARVDRRVHVQRTWVCDICGCEVAEAFDVEGEALCGRCLFGEAWQGQAGAGAA